MFGRRLLAFCVTIVALLFLALVPTATGQTPDSTTGVSSTERAPAGITLMNNQSVPPGSLFGSLVGNMTYHGGPVMRGPVKVYTIFWRGPSTSFPQAGYQTTINQFVNDLNNTPYFNIASQYSDGTGFIGTAASLGGTWLDTVNNFPSSNLAFSDLQAEVSRASTANSWVADANSYFQIYTPPGIFSTIGGICGLHWFASPIGQILYPQPGCYPGGPYPNNQDADSAINTSAHEIMETVTDPAGNAWFFIDASGEIGDMCNFIFGTRGGDGSDVTMNGRNYLIQQEWSNASTGCVMGFVPNTPTPTPTNTPTPNRNQIMTGTVVAGYTSTSTPTPTGPATRTPTITRTLTVTVTPAPSPGNRSTAAAETAGPATSTSTPVLPSATATQAPSSTPTATRVPPTPCSTRSCTSVEIVTFSAEAPSPPGQGLDVSAWWSQFVHILNSWFRRENSPA